MFSLRHLTSPMSVRHVVAAIVCAAVFNGSNHPAQAVSPEDVERLEAALAAKAVGEALHHYRFVQFPQQVRAMRDAVRLTEAEVDVLETRVENFRPFRSFKDLSPTFTAEQATRLQLLAAQQHLRRLKLEQARLNTHRRATIRDLQLQRLAALYRLQALAPAAE